MAAALLPTTTLAASTILLHVTVTEPAEGQNDVRWQMTVKLQKQMAERQRNRDTGGSTDTAPEVQAAEQIEEKVYTTVDGIRITRSPLQPLYKGYNGYPFFSVSTYQGRLLDGTEKSL